MKKSLLKIEMRYEEDVVHVRQRTRLLTELLGFASQEQTRIATAVSEIARNAFRYAKGGRAEFSISGEGPETYFQIDVTDAGGGIPHLDDVLNGTYTSTTGMGLGILGTKKLMDAFKIETSSTGTVVTLGKLLPSRIASNLDVGRIGEALARHRAQSAFGEIQLQNQELLQALAELSARQEELARLNNELEDTNKGVVALYAELDEKADHLQRVNDIKTRFLSNMTHEFRTPLNSILSLTQILLQETDGELSSEQQKQVKFIRGSAENLSELVNDLLDIAKVEAGKIQIKPTEFELNDTLSAIRGMLKPLLAQNSSVDLLVEDAIGIVKLFTDEAKLSQILRNFISNAIKYTERGAVVVTARMTSKDQVVISVADSGIGIEHADFNRIFDEFVQIDSPLQEKFKGTGLGLPLSKKLAELLGGRIEVESMIGQGSTFSLHLPVRIEPEKDATTIVRAAERVVDPLRLPVLVIEDNSEILYIYEKYLHGSPFQLLPARSLKEARRHLAAVRPVAIIADILLSTESSWSFIAELKSDPSTKKIPVLVITQVDNETKAKSVGADAFHVKPVEQSWLLKQLGAAITDDRIKKLLIIDDDEIARYLVKELLISTPYVIIEASSGAEGIELAAREQPSAILLDLAMPNMSGHEVLKRLKESDVTQAIPVIIHTSSQLNSPELQTLSANTVAILSKETYTRDQAYANLKQALTRAYSVVH